jgi:spore coat protein U-like protein
MRLAAVILTWSMLMLATAAQAAITCTASTAGFITAYAPTSTLTNVTQTSITVTCTRALATDPSSVAFTLAAGNGLNSNGVNNRAKFTSGATNSFIKYDVFRDAGCSSHWKGPTTIVGTISFASTGTVSQTIAYWGCVSAGQTGLPAGTYTDTVGVTLSYGPNPQSSYATAFNISIETPAVCKVPRGPDTIGIVYTSFGPEVKASTTFDANCTNALPYTMALDATSGVLSGVQYTLALSTPSSIGTGVDQTHTITATAVAGQAGTCTTANCTTSAIRTLTITY